MVGYIYLAVKYLFEYASHFKRYPMGMYVFKVSADILLRSNGEMI